MQSLERSARTKFNLVSVLIKHLLGLFRQLPCMLGGKIPLVVYVIKLFHRALCFIVDVIAYGTHVVPFVRRMTLTSANFTTPVASNNRDSHVSSTHSACTLFAAFHDRIASLNLISHFGRSGLLSSERDPQLQPCTHYVNPNHYPIRWSQHLFHCSRFPHGSLSQPELVSLAFGPRLTKEAVEIYSTP